MFARGFQQDQGAVGVDGEVRLRVLRRPVVGRLCRRVDHQGDVLAVPGEHGLDACRVANIDVVVAVGGHGRLEFATAPLGGGVVAEEGPPHVIVDADDVEALAAEEPHCFCADQARRSRYNCYAHEISPARNAIESSVF